MFWYLACLAAALWAAVAAWRGRRVRRAAAQFKNDIFAWPLIGHAHLFIGTSADCMKAYLKIGAESIKHGGLAKLWMGRQFFLVVSDPEYAEFLLKTFLEKDNGISRRFFQRGTGNGLIFASVAIWRPRRKVVAPMFSQKNLNGFVRVFERQSAVLAERLRTAAGGAELSLWQYFTTFTFDSVCETSMGIKLKAQYNGHPFLDAFGTFLRLTCQRTTQVWLHSDFVYKFLPQHKASEETLKYIFQFVDQVVQEKKNELAKEKNDSQNFTENRNGERSFLEMLMSASIGEAGFTDVELREEVLVMLMAGTDTSAVGASFTAVLLSRYPEEQDKIYDEIKEVLGDRILTFEDLPRLKNLDAFLKESLRLYPPVPLIAREIHRDSKLPSGETVVAGMSVAVHIQAMHRNPRYWGADADQFRPGRFLEGALKHPAQFIPFSYGMRNCIGYQYAMMSMKTALAALVRRYRLLPPAALPAAERTAPLPCKVEIMMKHADNFVVRLEPRD